ncbi:hypothetical protein MMC16_000194 [Acarospora aff. strigata]|nr:hypothetical protein [Acarospora aff. strigata]
MGLSVLSAAIWLTSTAFALVARPSDLRARADTTPKYPQGYDAKTCPLDTMTLIRHASLAKYEVLPAALTPSLTQRDLIAKDLFHICRQVGRFPFTSVPTGPGPLHIVSMQTPMVQPGLYVATATANRWIRSLWIAGDDEEYGAVNNNQADHIGVQFTAKRVQLQIIILLWSANTAGELDLFKIGPIGYRGPQQTG